MNDRQPVAKKAIRPIAPFVIYTVVYLGFVVVSGRISGYVAFVLKPWFLVVGLPLLVVTYAFAARAVGFHVPVALVMVLCAAAGVGRFLTWGIVFEWAPLWEGNAFVWGALWVLLEVGLISVLLGWTLRKRVIVLALLAAPALAVEFSRFYQAGQMGLAPVTTFVVLMPFDLLRNLGQFWLACWLKKEERDAR